MENKKFGKYICVAENGNWVYYKLFWLIIIKGCLYYGGFDPNDEMGT